MFRGTKSGQKTPPKITPNGSNIAKKGQFLAGGRKCPRGPDFVPGGQKRGKSGTFPQAETVRILLNTPNFPGVHQGYKIRFSGILPETKKHRKNSPIRFSYCEKVGVFARGRPVSPEDKFCPRRTIFVPGDRKQDKTGTITYADTVRILLNTPNFPGA